MILYVDNRDETFKDYEKYKNLLEKVISAVIAEELSYMNEKETEISLSFVNDEEMRNLNRGFRGVDRTTDVLSFPINEAFDIKCPMLGDVVINVSKIASQAEEYGHGFERELAYLTCHSMLHLIGYDHEDDEDKKVMRAREEAIMQSLEIGGDPYEAKELF